MGTDLDRRVSFLVEIDKLKAVERRSLLVDRSRAENSAEHSWHVATGAAVLGCYAGDDVNLSRVVQMLLIHDIVEIDAGDTFAYDDSERLSQNARESAAAERIFGLLPADQPVEMMALWQEFDAMETPDALFANSVDRFMPVLHNYFTDGHAWRRHGVTRGQVMRRVACIETGMPEMWPYLLKLLDDAVARGLLRP